MTVTNQNCILEESKSKARECSLLQYSHVLCGSDPLDIARIRK
jgi:hypothetical protein